VTPPAADRALALPWPAPSAASLIALARTPGPAAWPMVRHDPNAVLLLVRTSPDGLPATVLDHPAPLDAAGRWLHTAPASATAWDRPGLMPLWRSAVAHARLTAAVAARAGHADALTAWAAGLLAPLGWLAVASADPDAAAIEPASASRRWGMPNDALARRLATRWRLPAWLAVVAGHLTLPLDTAARLGADRTLVGAVRLTAALLDRAGVGLNLAGPLRPEEAAADLGWGDDELADLDLDVAAATSALPPLDWHGPHRLPLLPDLLAAAAENRRLRRGTVLEELHARLDQLHQALHADQERTAARLHEARLRSLAELAAGAGHEINNPLAVISGRAQLLLAREEDVGRRESLEAIVRQVRRVYDVLTGLMQFARPPKPTVESVDVAGLLAVAAAEGRDLATARGVSVEAARPTGLWVTADPMQARTALIALVRNAVEAAPAGGWVRLTAAADAGRVLLAVEDSGPGPTPAQRDHLFDPFYSGRPAGRGRGLGLPTAWRLARGQGGDVRFEPTAGGGPTRFVLELPQAGSGQARLSA
jgi:two-component system NtrC family sensor kinase